MFRDIRPFGFANEPPPLCYRPYSQAGWPDMTIVTRTTSAPGAFVASVKKALAAIEPNQPVAGVRTMLYDVEPADPLVLGAVSLLLTGVALVASYVPARRAARVDPISALRCE